MTQLKLIARRSRAVIQREGMWGAIARVIKYLRIAVGLPPRETREYYRRREEEARAFDAALGLDTGGTTHLFNLTTNSPNVEHAGPYIATSPDHFAPAMAMLDIDPTGTTFVDLGSGKGRALFLAANYPFARIIGVEFAAELDAITQENIRRFGDSRIENRLGDAEQFAYPAGDLVVFMNNPFDRPMVERIVGKLEQAVRDEPRTLRVIYINQAAEDLFGHAPWFVVGHEQGQIVLGIDGRKAA
jgi:SAM-dependent methyltransferase